MCPKIFLRTYGNMSVKSAFPRTNVLGFAIELTLIMKIQSHRKTVTNNAVFFTPVSDGGFLVILNTGFFP